jgi:carbonic anhydrase
MLTAPAHDVHRPPDRSDTMKHTSIAHVPPRPAFGRRRILAGIGACVMIGPALSSAQVLDTAAGALTKEQRDRLTPGEVIADLKRGNERFRTGRMIARDYREQQRSSAAGQYPAAVALGCVDSRAPAEIVCDFGIGDMFSARIAGNVINDDLLGSLEFACAVAGAKVVLLFGHTSCGAIKGAIDDVEMGNLTGLLARIKPAITATTFSGEKSSKNATYVDAVARTNVLLGLDGIRRRSPILEDLEKKGTIQMVGGMYDLATGTLEFLGEHR